MYPTDDVPKNISQMFEFNNLYNTEGLFPHQEFVRRFMSPHTPYKSVLLYHSPGSGKSLICISISLDHYISLSMKTIIVTKGESSSNSFRAHIRQYMKSTGMNMDANSIFHNYHYISLHNKIMKCSDEDVVNRFDDRIIVFDEIHNVRDIGVSSVYGSLMRMVRLCKGSRFILSSATPMVDNHNQIESIFNLLDNGYVSFNSTIQQKPDVVYMGTPNDHTIPRIEVVSMKGHQRDEYSIERSSNKVVDIYKKLTHIALFTFPENVGSKVLTEVKTKARVIPIDGKKSSREITFTSYSVPRRMVRFLRGEGLRMSSCKYHRLLRNISKSKGSVFVSIEEVHGSGLLLLARILEENGYELYYGQPISTPGNRYTICVGSSDVSPNIQERLDAFNSPENRDGSVIRILLGSRVIGESITLLNVRQFHSMSPHWNYSSVGQAMGRVVRAFSHNALNKEDRNVEVYVYITKDTVDEQKLRTCKVKQKMIDEQERLLERMSIERYSEGRVYRGDVRSFLLYYMDSYMKMLTEAAENIYSTRDSCTLRDISSDILRFTGYSFPDKIIQELLLRIITSNRQIRKNMFLREDQGDFFLHEDPSSPFHIIRPPPLEDMNEQYDIIDSPGDHEDPENVLEYIRSKSVPQKISILESILSKDDVSDVDEKILDLLKYLHTSVSGRKYHIVSYRNLSLSYSAMVPFPKKLTGKMRRMEGGRWKFVNDKEEEAFVISIMSERYYEKIRSIDDLHGMISVIDNKMRIRRGEEEKDKRKTLKGRCLISIRRDELLEICKSLQVEVPGGSKSSIVIKAIESYFLESGRYTVI